MGVPEQLQPDNVPAFRLLVKPATGTGRQTALPSSMFITGLGTAVPPQCYAQEAGWEALLQSTLFHQLQPRSRAILKKVLNGSSGIATRHLALENLGQAFELTPDVLQARFTRNAPAARDPGRGTRVGQCRQPAGRNRCPRHQHLHGLLVPGADELRERTARLPAGRACA